MGDKLEEQVFTVAQIYSVNLSIHLKFIDQGKVDLQVEVIKKNNTEILENLKVLKEESKKFASLSQEIQSHCTLFIKLGSE